MNIKKNNINDEIILLKNFNSRVDSAFGEVYNLLYKELYYFGSSLYRSTDIDSSDIIHDLFVKIWQDKKLKFETIENIKAYLYISIKNGFKNYLSHQVHIRKYQSEVIIDEDYFITKIIETETYSVISQAMEMLPEECAKVFRLVLDGWSVDEISQKLNKAKSTVYEHRQNAIIALKDKINKGKLLNLLLLIK